jgi:hypothetical protein
MTWRLIHLTVGLAGIVLFLFTGMHMRHHFPDAYATHEAVRFTYRANHVYVLVASLLNVCMSVYRTPAVGAAIVVLQCMGSIMLIVAAPVLIAAFYIEGAQGSPQRMLTLIGIVLLAVGTAMQLPRLLEADGR